MNTTNRIHEIDGNDFSTLKGFFETVWPLLTNEPFNGTTNLDAFNDILSWPERPFTLVWKNSELSRERLNHLEIAKKLEDMFTSCHPTNRENICQRIQEAHDGKGPTMFEWLIEIIRENQSYITLRLE